MEKKRTTTTKLATRGSRSNDLEEDICNPVIPTYRYWKCNFVLPTVFLYIVGGYSRCKQKTSTPWTTYTAVAYIFSCLSAFCVSNLQQMNCSTNIHCTCKIFELIRIKCTKFSAVIFGTVTETTTNANKNVRPKNSL